MGREPILHKYNGQEHTLTEWAAIKGVSYSKMCTLYANLKTIEAAMEAEIFEKKTYQGLDVRQWAKKLGIPRTVFSSRVCARGFEQAIAMGPARSKKRVVKDEGDFNTIRTECRCPRCGRSHEMYLIKGSDVRRMCRPCKAEISYGHYEENYRVRF